MSEQLSNRDLVVWQRLAESHAAWATAQQEFFSVGVNRVELIRRALNTGDGVATALIMARYMDPAELQQLFNELMNWVSGSEGYAEILREIIQLLPRRWLLANIEITAEPLLAQGTDREYRRLLELYIEIDRELTLRLAQRAIVNPNQDIQEAGEDFLEKLSAS